MAATARVFGHSLTRFLKHIRKCHRTPCTSGAQPQPAALPRLGASIRRPAAILALKATLPSQRPFQIKPSTRQGHQSPSNQRHPAPKLVNSSPSSSHPLKVSYTLSPIQRRCECASREGTAPKRREHGVRHRSDSRAWCASTLCFEWMGERHQREHAARLESRHPVPTSTQNAPEPRTSRCYSPHSAPAYRPLSSESSSGRAIWFASSDCWVYSFIMALSMAPPPMTRRRRDSGPPPTSSPAPAPTHQERKRWQLKHPHPHPHTKSHARSLRVSFSNS